jgi:hypothetical protein
MKSSANFKITLINCHFYFKLQLLSYPTTSQAVFHTKLCPFQLSFHQLKQAAFPYHQHQLSSKVIRYCPIHNADNFFPFSSTVAWSFAVFRAFYSPAS